MISPNRSILVIILLFSTVVLNAQDAPIEIPQPRKMEEFKFTTQGYVKMLLDGFFVELWNNPANDGHVIIYPKTERQRRGIEKIITGQIKTRNFDRSRITLVKGPINADGVVQFWSIPPGAEAPKPVLGAEVQTGSGDGTVKPNPGAGMAPGTDKNPVLREPTPSIIPPDQPVRILSKAPARYTPRARQNGVEGTVVLKITFLANRTIGNITVVSGLSDGLTEQAVNAAKLIRFEPAIENGVAVSKIKLLTYSFNIY